VPTFTPGFFFPYSGIKELGVPIGGMAQLQFTTSVSNTSEPVDYSISFSLSATPPGTTATITPSTIVPGQTVTVTMTASSSAPVTQNLNITLTGTASAAGAQSSVNFFADVTQSSGSYPNNRTDYTTTEANDLWGAYDASHSLIFAVNDSWNRIDVLSASTHALVNHISIPDPQWIDITPDNSTAWVSTGSHQMFAINTSNLIATRYVLPNYTPPDRFYPGHWQGGPVYALADGTLLLDLSGSQITGGGYQAIWDPIANTMTRFAGPSSPAGHIVRSGDGKRVYSISVDSTGASFYYDVLTKTFSGDIQIGGYADEVAANYDGTRVAIDDTNGLDMYDSNLGFLGPLPGGGFQGFFGGGLVFASSNGYLYEESWPFGVPILFTIDPNTLNIQNIAPALAVPTGDDIPDIWFPVPFAVDSTGMVFGTVTEGIAFDDATYTQEITPDTLGTPNFFNHMTPSVGSLTGGTVSGGFGNGVNLAPGVWYGPNQGTSQLLDGSILQIASPPGSAPGPVNVKMLFPDGVEVFNPLFFSYGPFIQYNVLSGSSPDGGVAGQIGGYGLPADSSGGSIRVGGTAAAIGKVAFLTAPGLHGFPPVRLNFTIPAGVPGWADISVSTPDGQSTLPKSLFYAQSVKDYPSGDKFTAILYDDKRKQLYLSAGDHIDVFSLNSDQFLSPLTPPAQGGTKEFSGLALTPDGNTLLAADLLDGSLTVINPDQSSSAYVIPVTPVNTGDPRCSIGPIYVAAVSNNQAFTMLGGIPGVGCGPNIGSAYYEANLVTKQAAPANFPPNCPISGNSIASTRDGTRVAIGSAPFAIYDVIQNSCYFGGTFAPGGDVVSGAYISADGNVASSQYAFTDSAANIIGRVGQPDIYYDTFSFPTASTAPLQQPKLNDAGSLDYFAYPNFFDIVDVQHGLLKMRFSLVETVLNTAVPLAIDSGGRQVYLLTNKGLTIVDLGEAPLSIGWLNPATGASGTQITVRGSGFTTSTTAMVSGKPAAVSFIDENTLTLVIPSVPSGPSDIVLSNTVATYILERALSVL
jgi:hypothetical protein